MRPESTPGQLDLSGPLRQHQEPDVVGAGEGGVTHARVESVVRAVLLAHRSLRFLAGV